MIRYKNKLDKIKYTQYSFRVVSKLVQYNNLIIPYTILHCPVMFTSIILQDQATIMHFDQEHHNLTLGFTNKIVTQNYDKRAVFFLSQIKTGYKPINILNWNNLCTLQY